MLDKLKEGFFFGIGGTIGVILVFSSKEYLSKDFTSTIKNDLYNLECRINNTIRPLNNKKYTFNQKLKIAWEELTDDYSNIDNELRKYICES
tara:strand:+ start:6336 stop:6611 length:276 start_codon:yes stop_codon:yes gene_type:complete